MAKKATKRNAKPERAPGRIRGLRRAEYLALFRMVRKGETNWSELERLGIVLPAGRESDFRRNVRNTLANRK